MFPRSVACRSRRWPRRGSGCRSFRRSAATFDASCESARTALAKNPSLAEAHWRLAITLKGRLPDAELQAIERLALDQSLPEKARAFLHYGLAAVCDDRGLYSQAAVHAEAASTLDSRAMAMQGRQHDPDADSRFIDQMIAAFDAELFVRMRGWVKADPRPIFVVGLQRSGTSLVEQILASHPQIHGAGELRDVGRIFEALPEIRRSTVARFVRCIELAQSRIGDASGSPLSRTTRPRWHPPPRRVSSTRCPTISGFSV